MFKEYDFLFSHNFEINRDSVSHFSVELSCSIRQLSVIVTIPEMKDWLGEKVLFLAHGFGWVLSLWVVLRQST